MWCRSVRCSSNATEYFREMIKTDLGQRNAWRVPIMSWSDYREKLKAAEGVAALLLNAIKKLED
jgi:hypothetical protein